MHTAKFHSAVSSAVNAPAQCIVEQSTLITGVPVIVAYKENGDSNLAGSSFTYGSSSSMNCALFTKKIQAAFAHA